MSLWYKDAVFYELHVKAFQDSGGDGIGDFRGLVNRLDYLEGLGVTCLWLLPFYPSPLRDDGYDIADYYGVHPDYGTIEDVRHFLEEAHRRGMRVIADLVLNHTSDQHGWFQRARRAPKGSPDRDWYVWSDTDDRYPEARIIFTDTEPSNWTWDPVAQQYYWHRFFAHQPDLNWDNPRVKEAMFQVMEFWLELGLDGFRADAVPYLIERDGTICENLPETHQILREFRTRLDARYPDRILLAEANQWPEDVRPYFGSSDEFHMAFHFPLMPRIFMAVRRGNRDPVVEIIERTPPIPDDCQWCMFLRNHDELTLEMVTDDERDYMYQEYAADPRMRLNLGIRRRLAPLLDNDRRKIELLNSILFTMPGTPIVYYGDEIGMGDNIYLGDRDGVRTPMQWSPDRNAGFSRADPQRLYLPAITDSIYGFQGVNVEAQDRSPFSLLGWMRRLIQVRKAHPAFGRGSIEFLPSANRRILAYLREYEDDTLLVVNNLAGSAQAVALDLKRYAGQVPLELLGQTEFLPISESPYPITLAPYGFFWFALRPAAVARTEADAPETAETLRQWALEDAATLAHPETLQRVLAGVSPVWLHSQRWFRSKGREVVAIRAIDHAIAASDGRPPIVLAVSRAESSDGATQDYLLALSLRPPTGVAPEPIATLDAPAAPRAVALYDAFEDGAIGRALARLIVEGSEIDAAAGAFRGFRTSAFDELSGPPEPVRLLTGEQTNSTLVLGEQSIVKVFRRMERGVNPDLEVTNFLIGRTGFRAIPALAGWVEYLDGDGLTTPIAGLFRYVPNRGTAWEHTQVALSRFFNAASRSAADPYSISGQASLKRMAGESFQTASALGKLTGDLHLALASATSTDPDFGAVPISEADVEDWTDQYREQTVAILGELGRRLETIPGAFPADIRKELGVLAHEAAELAERFMDLRVLADARVTRIRVHGDYHLGQLMRAEDPQTAGGEWIVFDFEGEPALELEDRRARHSPLRDVAGMLRSFDYAVKVATRQFPTDDHRAKQAIRTWGGAWLEAVRTAFLQAYREATAGASFVPGSSGDFDRVVSAFELQKAIYEIGYEIDNRPEWLWVPLEGIISIRNRTP